MEITTKKTDGRGMSEKSRANLRPFKPGQSGNPKGGPHKRPITERYQRAIEEPLPTDVLVVLRKAGVKLLRNATIGDAIAAMQARAALKDISVAREIADRLEGKPAQRIEFSGPEGGPVELSTAREKLLSKLTQ